MGTGLSCVLIVLLPLPSARVCRNFAKLPVGVVCVAEVQFKGRGACDSAVTNLLVVIPVIVLFV
jgi:hypothetical protein